MAERRCLTRKSTLVSSHFNFNNPVGQLALYFISNGAASIMSSLDRMHHVSTNLT